MVIIQFKHEEDEDDDGIYHSPDNHRDDSIGLCTQEASLTLANLFNSTPNNNNNNNRTSVSLPMSESQRRIHSRAQKQGIFLPTNNFEAASGSTSVKAARVSMTPQKQRRPFQNPQQQQQPYLPTQRQQQEEQYHQSANRSKDSSSKEGRWVYNTYTKSHKYIARRQGSNSEPSETALHDYAKQIHDNPPDYGFSGTQKNWLKTATHTKPK